MAIIKIDLTDENAVLTGTILKNFQLVNPDTTATPQLEAGRTEEIGGAFYQVDGGNLTPSGSPSDGWVYLYTEDFGGGTITASLTNTAPTWNGQGWYNGNAKCTHVMIKEGSLYYEKQRIEQYYYNPGEVSDTVGNVILTGSPATYVAMKTLTLTPGRWEIILSLESTLAGSHVNTPISGIDIDGDINYWISDTTGAAPTTSAFADSRATHGIDYTFSNTVDGTPFTITLANNISVYRRVTTTITQTTTVYATGYFTNTANITNARADKINFRARRLPRGPIA